MGNWLSSNPNIARFLSLLLCILTLITRRLKSERFKIMKKAPVLEQPANGIPEAIYSVQIYEENRQTGVLSPSLTPKTKVTSLPYRGRNKRK